MCWWSSTRVVFWCGDGCVAQSDTCGVLELHDRSGTGLSNISGAARFVGEILIVHCHHWGWIMPCGKSDGFGGGFCCRVGLGYVLAIDCKSYGVRRYGKGSELWVAAEWAKLSGGIGGGGLAMSPFGMISGRWWSVGGKGLFCRSYSGGQCGV